MYEDFYELSERPFRLAPDPQYIYWTTQHRRAFEMLLLGIRRLAPITVVTGEVGSGKTTLIREFLRTADNDLTIGLLSNVIGDQADLYRWIMMALDEPAAAGDRPGLARQLEELLLREYAAGRRTVLIVDEAQNLSDEGLEALRLATNINSGKDALLLLVLVGQPQLRQRLAARQLRQLRQRVGASFHLEAMTRAETRDYVRFRLETAGGSPDIFDDAALAVIHAEAGGVPRVVNTLCDLCLVMGFADGTRHLTGPYVTAVIEEARDQNVLATLSQSHERARPSPASDAARDRLKLVGGAAATTGGSAPAPPARVPPPVRVAASGRGALARLPLAQALPAAEPGADASRQPDAALNTLAETAPALHPAPVPTRRGARRRRDRGGGVRGRTDHRRCGAGRRAASVGRPRHRPRAEAAAPRHNCRCRSGCRAGGGRPRGHPLAGVDAPRHRRGARAACNRRGRAGRGRSPVRPRPRRGA